MSQITGAPGMQGILVLEDDSRFAGRHFGFPASVKGEVVFNTGMVGYTEALTDPSYRGQVLVLTYPLIGNYGVPETSGNGSHFESNRIQVTGLVVSEVCLQPNHWSALKSLSAWLQSEGVPALCSVDTRLLTKRLRNQGTMLGSIELEIDNGFKMAPPSAHPVADVTVDRPITYERGEKRVVLIDCGCKESIIRNLVDRNITI